MIQTKYSILVAEDDADDRLLIQDAFEANGMGPLGIHYVENGEELTGFLMQTENLPLLIFLDLNMPKKDGRETIREIKSNPDLKQIPIVIFTTSCARSDIELAYDLGANTYFTKPNRYSELVEIIRVIKEYWLEKAKIPEA